MSETPTTTIRIDPKLKEDARQILEPLGLTLSAAITLYLRVIVRNQGIPFDLKNSSFTNHNDKKVIHESK